MPLPSPAHRRAGAACVRRLSLAVAVCVTAAVAPATAIAAPPQLHLQLDDAVQLAVERAPMLASRRAGIESARQESQRAGGLPDPTLQLGLVDLPVTTRDAFDFSTDDFTMSKVGVVQDVPSRRKRDARRAVADRTVDQAVALSAAETLLVKRRAAEAWVSLWAAMQEVEALRSLREQSALATRTATARLGGGSGSAADVLATRSATLALENRIDAAQAQCDVARAMLDRWLGDDAGVDADESPDFGTLPVDAATLLSSIDRQAPLLPWKAREDVASAQVALASAEKRPDWSVGASYGHRNRYSDFFSLQVSIGLPLFTANRQDRGVAARHADYEATLDAHEDARRAQRETVVGDLARWSGLQRQVVRDDTQLLPVAGDRSDVALAAYRGGGALQPWLDARRDEIEIHVAHARMTGDLGRAWAALAYLLDGAQP